MKNIDFLSIGDITTDAFIILSDAEVTCDIDQEGCKLCVDFGDKIPYDKVVVVPAVGNSANASVSASRLGLRSGLLTHIGEDRNGEECLETLRKEKVLTDFCIKEKGVDTNYHYVLSYLTERTILVKHNHFSYDFKKESRNLPIPKLLYLSSLGEGTTEYHDQIMDWVEENKIKMAFQPGTYQMKLGVKNLARVYKNSEYFFCNVEEAQRILETTGSDIKTLLQKIHELGPKIVFITNGKKGAYAYDSYSDKMYHQIIYPDQNDIVDRTGAGDSFSSTASIALATGESVETALMWGPINSASVIKYIGAREGLLTKDELKELLAKAPADYKPSLI